MKRRLLWLAAALSLVAQMNFLTGDIAWEARSVGKGSLTYADGHFYCLSETAHE